MENFKCTCGGESFNINTEGNSIKCIVCGNLAFAQTAKLVQENDRLHLANENLQKDVYNLKETLLIMQKAMVDLENQLHSSEERKINFRRNIFCSMLANNSLTCLGEEELVKQTTSYLNSYLESEK